MMRSIEALPRNAYEEYEASPEECLGLEPLIAWDAYLMERRLEDHFAGKQNAHVERQKNILLRSLRGQP